MIVDVLRKLKIDVSYTMYRAGTKFQSSAIAMKRQFSMTNELKDIKAACPKDN